jgi:two-component system sensor histidine kinase HydH
LKQLLEEVVAVVKEEADNSEVGLEIVHADGLQPLNVDPMRLEQALLNLVINAVQASIRGEVVTLRAIPYNGAVAIEVSDRGPGVPAQTRSQIFDPFFTTKKEGTGLGLPIVNKIVEAHAGRLEIVDNPDRGVTFRIVLPGD